MVTKKSKLLKGLFIGVILLNLVLWVPLCLSGALRSEPESREEMGYINDPKIHQDVEKVLKASGYSCPGVHGVRKMGDQGRGPVLGVQCKNNVFFMVTVLPGNRGFSIEIKD